MPIFARAIDNFDTTLASAHATGDGTLALAPGAGARITAQVGPISASNPVRLTVVRATALTNGQVTDLTKMAVFTATGLAGDTLSGLTFETVPGDQPFSVSDPVYSSPSREAADEVHAAITANADAIATLQSAGADVVHTTGSYADPTWITGLAGSKLTGTVVATSGVVTTGSYADPAWITSLGAAKITTGTLPAGVIPQIAHASLSGLATGDPHTQYALLAGRAGGQAVAGDVTFANRIGSPGRTGPITTVADNTTITFDLAVSDRYRTTPAGDRTLALTNPAVGQQFTLILVGDGTARNLTWFSGVTWFTVDGLKPTPASGAGKRTIVTFLCESAGVYLGFVVGTQV